MALSSEELAELERQREAEAAALIPNSCTRRQGRLALLAYGLLDDAETAIAAITDAAAKREAQIEYEADTWERSNPFLASLWTQLGGTPQSLDEAFALAVTLTNTTPQKPASAGFFMPGGGRMDNNWFDQLLPKVPGILGSAGALMWMQGTWPRKGAMLVLGIAASNYGTPDFVVATGLSEGLAGFVVGMFSMTAADWVFRAWDQFALGPLLNEWVRKRLGLPPKDGGAV